MQRILIISSMYTQMQHIKRLLHLQPDRYQICGTADNSVLGMSLIETAKPDLVIMPVFMTFWNAEDLVNYLLPRGICPTFILLNSSTCTIDTAAATKVAEIIPNMMPTPDQFFAALEIAVLHHQNDPITPNSSSVIQHSLEVMELLMGLSPLDTREAHQKFGRLRVGKKACWILLGAPNPDQADGYHLFSQIHQLEEPFQAIPKLLHPLGDCEVCIYRDNNLCILLAEGQHVEPDWETLCNDLNYLLKKYGIPELSFEISDMPLPMEFWYSQCRELLELRQKRFFFSPLFLQPKTLVDYKVFVTQPQLHAKLSALSQAIHGMRQIAVTEALNELEALISHSLSMELYSYTLTQMVVQYSNFKNTLSLPSSMDDHAIFYPNSFHTLDQVFHAYETLLLSLMDETDAIFGSSNQIVQAVCSYINQNLTEPLTLEMVASYVHINPTYLSRLFKKETSIAFSTYVNQARIAKAMQLLETEIKISDISSMVGYENAKYFSHVFKKTTGRTPQEYRKTRRKDSKS